MFRNLIIYSHEGLEYRFASLKQQLYDGKHQPLQKILVNGSPRSGTTWMVSLLKSIPGYQSVGNFQGDMDSYLQVKPGDVIHGHEWYSDEFEHTLNSMDIKTLNMVRDPRDQAVSRMFHVRRDTQLPWSAPLNEMSLDDALMACIEGRKGLRGIVDAVELVKSWEKSEERLLFVKFEELVANPMDEFQKVLDYLQIHLNEALVSSIAKRNRFERLTRGRKLWRKGRKPGQLDTDSHLRKGIVGDWQTYFNGDHIIRTKELAGELLIELGYEKDFDW